MLGKLLKYEMKATSRIFLPLYLVLLVYSAIHKVISSFSPNKLQLPQALSLMVYIMILCCMLVVTIVVMIQRFYKNLLTDEGYLMFTLPTKTWKHIASKLTVSMLWMVLSGIVAIASIFIVAFNEITKSGFIQFVTDFTGKFFEYYGTFSIILVIEALLLLVIGLAQNILVIYASIAVGHLANKYRVLTSLGAFIIINTASQIIMTIVTAIGSLFPIPKFTSTGFMIATDPLIQFGLWAIMILTGLLSAGYFILANYILSRKLNLE